MAPAPAGTIDLSAASYSGKVYARKTWSNLTYIAAASLVLVLLS
jgi:hypothetical protein